MSSAPIQLRPDDPEAVAALGAALPEGVAEQTAVALVASESAHRTGWAATAAVALARAWAAATPRRVLLVDLSLERPVLHDALGVRNQEGMADVFLFGASMARVRRPMGEGFDFVSAGPYVPDPTGVLEHRSWARLLENCAAEDTVVLAYVPAELEGAATLISRLGTAVLLAGDVTPGVVRVPDGVRVLAALTAAAPPRLTDDDFERIRLPRDGAREQLIGDLRQRQRDAVQRGRGGRTQSADVSDAAAERARRAPAPPRQSAGPMAAAGASGRVTRKERPARPSRRHPLWWVLAVVLLASVVGGAWHVWLRDTLGPVPFSGVLTRGGAPAPEEGAAAATVLPPPPGAEPVDSLLAWFVGIEAHADLDVALARHAALESADTGLPFHLTPSQVDTVVFWRLMAGPVTDSAAAVVLLDTLVARGHKSGGATWDLREAPLAFLLGDYDQREAAAGRAEQLAEDGVPAYLVRTPYTAGPDRWRVYAGSFRGPAEADVMRPLLAEAGLEAAAELVERVGRAVVR